MRKHVEIYRDAEQRRRRWRWRLVAGNGQVVAGPQQSYSTRWGAKRAARREHPTWPLVVVS
jgi:uncharacterized protein YegP (UPF0339 family)